MERRYRNALGYAVYEFDIGARDIASVIAVK